MQHVRLFVRGVFLLALTLTSACSSNPSSMGGGETADPHPPVASDPPPSAAALPPGEAPLDATEVGYRQSVPSRMSIPAVERRWESVLLARISTGAGEHALGLVPARQEERARGPNAFAVASDGRVLISDNQNGRLVTLDPAGRWNSSVDLRDARYISSLEPLDARRFVAYQSLEDTLLVLGEGGKLERRVPTDRALQPFGGLFQMGEGALAYRAGNTFFSLRDNQLKSTGLSAAKLSRSHSRALPDGRFVATRRDGSGKIELVVRTGSGQASVVRRAVIEPPIPERIGSATFLAADGQGRLFVRVEVLNSGNPLRVRRFVSVYDADLKRVGTFEYPLGLVTPPEDDVQVDAAGRVYVLISYEDRFELRRFEP